jgi:hypothetical protein
MPPPHNLRQAIFENGWRQGSVISEIDHESLVALSGRSLSNSNICILVGQSCDILQEDLASEPSFEVIVGTWIATPNPVRIAARNPRELHLPVTTSNGPEHACLLIRDRVFVDRTWLSEHKADPTRTLNADSLGWLVRWMAGRYDRTALPDSFNGRIDPKRKDIAKLLDSARELTGLYVALNPWDEADERTVYQIALLGIVKDADYTNTQVAERLQNVLERIARKMKKCDGIAVDTFDVRSEREVTIEEIKRYRKFDFDYLSLRSPDSHAAANPQIT